MYAGWVEALTPATYTGMGAGETQVGPAPWVSQAVGHYQSPSPDKGLWTAHCQHLLLARSVRAPGPSSERRRAADTARAPRPQSSPLCGSPERAPEPTSPASFQSSQTDLCSATEMERAGQHRGSPADPASLQGVSTCPSPPGAPTLTKHRGPVQAARGSGRDIIGWGSVPLTGRV